MKKIILFTIIFSFINMPVNSQAKKVFEKFSWLEGNWENINDKNQMYESWQKVNDSLLTGESFTIKDNDTVSYESIKIALIDDNIFFIPLVRNQNEGKVVFFKLISYDKEAIFENKEHDFPQRIIYSFNGTDSLNAWIEGEKNGSYKKIPFSYKRK